MSCNYAQPSTRKRQTTNLQASSTPDDMQHRIDRLEGLVLSLMTNGNQAAGPAAAQRTLSMDSGASSAQAAEVDIVANGNNVPREGGSEESETDQMVQSLGVMKVDNTNKSTMYVGDAHWASVLSDVSCELEAFVRANQAQIAEVKNYFSEHKKQYDDQVEKVKLAKERMDSNLQGPMFFFGSSKSVDMDDLIKNMPKRTVAERLISRYFNFYDPAVHILHPPSWYQECERYWSNPQGASPAWIGQMYAVFSLAMISYHAMGEEPEEARGKSLEAAANYRNLAGQALTLADFTKPVAHMIETLVLYLHCEFSRARDTEIAVWILAGMILRLAMRMGYHRDPKYYSNITPFQGELRRRVWTFVRQSDLLFSFQIGLPSMIREGDCDTELPRNLHDHEFDENVESLPPSRPPSEPTPVSYMRTKAIMAIAFGKVVERLHMTTNCTYEDILALDEGLRNVLAEFPPHLRMRSLEESAHENGALVMQRFNLATLYHKAQCVLHRKFLSRARENSRYAHSRRTCIDSAMDLLRIQEILHSESRPGRKLVGHKIFVSSLTATDFLLAAMIVSLDLCNGTEVEGNPAVPGDTFVWGSDRRADMIRSLETAQNIWKESLDHSMEAYKAFTILTIMFNKLRSSKAQQGRGSQNPFAFLGGGASMEGQAYNTRSLEDKPEHSAAMTLGMLSSGMTGNSGPQFNGLSPANTDTPMGNMQNVPENGYDQMNTAAQGAPNVLGFFEGAMLPGMDTSGTEANIDWVSSSLALNMYTEADTCRMYSTHISRTPTSTSR